MQRFRLDLQPGVDGLLTHLGLDRGKLFLFGRWLGFCLGRRLGRWLAGCRCRRGFFGDSHRCGFLWGVKCPRAKIDYVIFLDRKIDLVAGPINERMDRHTIYDFHALVFLADIGHLGWRMLPNCGKPGLFGLGRHLRLDLGRGRRCLFCRQRRLVDRLDRTVLDDLALLVQQLGLQRWNIGVRLAGIGRADFRVGILDPANHMHGLERGFADRLGLQALDDRFPGGHV